MTRYSAQAAQQRLDQLSGSGIRVLGAEGFYERDGATVPEMNAILDLSAFDDPQASLREAGRFIAETAADGLVYELVLDDPD